LVGMGGVLAGRIDKEKRASELLNEKNHKWGKVWCNWKPQTKKGWTKWDMNKCPSAKKKADHRLYI